MSVTVRAAALRDVSFVAAHMRASDRREIYCQRADEDSSALAWQLVRASPGTCYAAWASGSPVTAFGASELHPGMWTAWAFGTAGMRRALPAVTRHIKARLIPDLLAAGANRVEARSLAGHRQAHRWLASLGAVRECALPGYGRDGEDFVQFAWRRAEVAPDR